MMVATMQHLEWQNLTQRVPDVTSRFSVLQLQFLTPALQYCYPAFRYKRGADLVYSPRFDSWRINSVFLNVKDVFTSFQCPDEASKVQTCEGWH